MATHQNKESQQLEVFEEMIQVIEYCLQFEKEEDLRWEGGVGCYGYPALVLLMSLLNSFSELIFSGKNKEWGIVGETHQYYQLGVTIDETPGSDFNIFKGLRNKVIHESHITEKIILCLGNPNERIFEKATDSGDKYIVRLKPFLERTKSTLQTIRNKANLESKIIDISASDISAAPGMDSDIVRHTLTRKGATKPSN